MEIHTKGEYIFYYADVKFPAKCTLRVYDEPTLVKLILKQRDLAGIHFFIMDQENLNHICTG